MHIPDGFLSTKVAGACAALALAGVGAALRRETRESWGARTPLLGVTAAFVFAAQMVNFPVVAGTSGHLVGAVLATSLVGIRPAIIVMTSVLLAQCFVFGDGGVLALGANVLNMAVMQPVVGGLILTWLKGRSTHPRRALAALGCAAWTATVLSSLFCAGELAMSGTAPAGPVFVAMGGIHMLIGLGEAIISMLVVAAVLRMRPELVLQGPAAAIHPRQFVALGLIASLAIALFIAPFACDWPDGLGRVAEVMGFSEKATSAHLAQPLLQDYRVPGGLSTALATGLAGVVGAMLVFVGAWLLSRWLAPTEPRCEGPLTQHEHLG